MVVLCETHLRSNDETIDVPLYTCISYPRQFRHVRAKRNYGGVCILVRNCLLQYFDFNIIERSYDGILAVKFDCKISHYCFLVVAMYLPPEQSVWGRDSVNFYNHLMKIVYEYENCDNIILAGDVNSKIGNAQEYIPDIDDVTPRKILDPTFNSHGKELLDFLKDSKMCVCNGRVTPEFDDYTYVHTKGKSVIDYVIVPNDALNSCKEFRVRTVKELLNLCSIDDAEIDLHNVPDHSVLTFRFNTSAAGNDSLNCENGRNFQRSASSHEPVIDANDIYFKRFNVKSLPNDFLNNENVRSALIQLIDDIIQLRENQTKVDELYSKFCCFYHDEMKAYLACKDTHPRLQKCIKKRKKPFWNDNLTTLWKIACQKEKRYLKAQGASRRIFRSEFVQAQKLFDKSYRKAKRNYNHCVINDLENLSGLNPTEFWHKMKRLGPRQKDEIPWEVYDEYNNLKTDSRSVLEKWRSEFEKLYNFEPGIGEFDDTFYRQCKAHLENLENEDSEILSQLNDRITIEEVKKVVHHAKSDKAVGIDNLPFEVLKNDKSYKILTALFDKLYEYGLTPSVWNMAIIRPIPKNSLVDARLPLEYRGISLLSTIYKLYTGILNNRIVKVAESNNIYAEEQNGFRKSRSCEDHIFTLSSIVRNRKRERLPTFVAFVDFEKAFDRVNRVLLFYKLKSMGFNGKMLRSIQSIYSECKALLKVNGCLTDSFCVQSGVRQGDTLSPTLFGLYVNDLATSFRSSGNGIQLSDSLHVASLLYADDLAIIAESEDKLQHQLNILMDWCRKWQMRVNIKKTKVVHFRVASQNRTNFHFKFNEEEINCVEKYKYLGVILQENLDFNVTASVLAGSGSRALGGIISKFKKLKGLGFNTYSSLYQSGVIPILDYCSGVWGYQQYSQIDSVQNRAVRFFLGIHRFAPNLAINGDTGWIPCHVRRKVNLLRFWNRLVKFENSRLTKKVFLWDHARRRSVGSWSSDVYKILGDLNLAHVYENLYTVNLGVAKQQLYELYKITWKTEMRNVPKLRTYVRFKECYETESYLYKIHDRRQRSLVSQFRCGILPLKVETGRYHQIPREFRLCIFCQNNDIEDEIHFFFHCNFYATLRFEYMEKIFDIYPRFPDLDENEKLKICMNSVLIKDTARFITDCVDKRQKFLYQ